MVVYTKFRVLMKFGRKAVENVQPVSLSVSCHLEGVFNRMGIAKSRVKTIYRNYTKYHVY